MKSLVDSQELARRFNEQEAAWQCFEQKRRLRRRLGSESLAPDEVLDELDWREAEQECPAVRAVGSRFPQI